MDKQEVLQSKFSINKECLIYFLINENEIVYVGQTKQGMSRVFQHFNTKEYDSYSVCKCKQEELNELEAYYIIKFNPYYNSDVLPQNNMYKSIPSIKKQYRINALALKKIAKLNNLQMVFNNYYRLDNFILAFNKAKENNIIRYKPHKNFDWVCNSGM